MQTVSAEVHRSSFPVRHRTSKISSQRQQAVAKMLSFPAGLLVVLGFLLGSLAVEAERPPGWFPGMTPCDNLSLQWGISCMSVHPTVERSCFACLAPDHAHHFASLREPAHLFCVLFPPVVWSFRTGATPSNFRRISMMTCFSINW